MKPSLRILISAAAMALPLPAFAADYDPPIVVDQPVEEVPVEVGSGWYLRGDIGYNFEVDAQDNFDFRTFDPFTGAYGSGTFDTASLGDGVTWSAGFGYNFTDMFRADFTVDGFRSNFDGATSSAAPCFSDPALAGTGCRSEDESTAAVLSFMVNGYVDLGTYVGFTPYVGGGLGYTYVDWGPLSDSTLLHRPCLSRGTASPTPSTTATRAGASPMPRWSALPMTSRQNLKVDLGYRYRRIEGGPMFAFDPGSIAAGASGTQGDDPGFSSHEVRVGLRYALW